MTCVRRWKWCPPPGWPQAANGWHPNDAWRPDPRWDVPPLGWDWWEPLERFEDWDWDRPIPIPAVRPDLAGIPLAWVAPPGWPATPVGWQPPAGWKPPRRWGRTPTGWRFWQPDPGVIETRRQRWWTELVRDCESLTKSGELATIELGTLERSALRVWLTTQYVLEVPEFSAERGAVVPANHPARTALIASGDAYLRALSKRREFLLQWAAGEGAAGAAYAQLLVEEENADDAFDTADGNWIGAAVDYFKQCRSPQLVRERLPERAVAEIMEAEADVVRTHWDIAHKRAYRDVFGDPEPAHTVEINAAWQEAEELAARFLRTVGFTDADVTVTGSDGGFDVIGRAIVAQVKYLAAAVGRPDVQRLVGANRHGARMAFFSRTGYAAPAVQYADQTAVALFQIQLPGSVEPVNAEAHQMIKGASGAWVRAPQAP